MPCKIIYCNDSSNFVFNYAFYWLHSILMFKACSKSTLIKKIIKKVYLWCVQENYTSRWKKAKHVKNIENNRCSIFFLRGMCSKQLRQNLGTTHSIIPHAVIDDIRLLSYLAKTCETLNLFFSKVVFKNCNFERAYITWKQR